MLKIENLHVAIDDKPNLKGLSIEAWVGGVHVVMGPDGLGLWYLQAKGERA